MPPEEALVFLVVISGVPAAIAHHKGRSGIGFFMLSLIVTPVIAIIIALAITSKNKA